MILIHKVNDQIMECKNTHYGFKMMNAIYYYYLYFCTLLFLKQKVTQKQIRTIKDPFTSVTIGILLL